VGLLTLALKKGDDPMMKKGGIDARTIAVTAIMIAVVAVFTRFIVVPIGTGYFNFSDVAIYFAAFAFGPWVGLVAGGVGAALADISLGYSQFAILTFFAHGLEGLVAGYLGRGNDRLRMLLGWLAGTIVMVGLYFLGEATVPAMWGGLPQALTEWPFNLLQNVAGGIVGIPLVLAVRRAYPPITQMGPWRER
jgi:energy-coupling factor transport system substrate-specific component